MVVHFGSHLADSKDTIPYRFDEGHSEGDRCFPAREETQGLITSPSQASKVYQVHELPSRCLVDAQNPSSERPIVQLYNQKYMARVITYKISTTRERS